MKCGFQTHVTSKGLETDITKTRGSIEQDPSPCLILKEKEDLDKISIILLSIDLNRLKK